MEKERERLRERLRERECCRFQQTRECREPCYGFTRNGWWLVIIYQSWCLIWLQWGKRRIQVMHYRNFNVSNPSSRRVMHMVSPWSWCVRATFIGTVQICSHP